MRVGKGKENLKMAIEEKKRYDQYLNKSEEWKLNSRQYDDTKWMRRTKDFGCLIYRSF